MPTGPASGVWLDAVATPALRPRHGDQPSGLPAHVQSSRLTFSGTHRGWLRTKCADRRPCRAADPPRRRAARRPRARAGGARPPAVREAGRAAARPRSTARRSPSGRQRLAETGGPSLLFPEEFGGLGMVGSAIASFETLAYSDLSLLVKCGVQFGLFGGAVHHLGTRKHHELYLERVATFDLPGAFAMSESGHGSNVQRVQTTATYDPVAQEFVVNTPTDEDRKDYIGNAARDGQMAAVFCQLHVGGEKPWSPLHPRAAPRQEGQGVRRHPDRGLRPQARTERRGQRAHLVRRRARPAREPARPLRAGERRRRLLQPDRERGPALLHDARHAHPGTDQRRRRVDLSDEGRAHDRRPARRQAAPVRPARLRGGDAASRLPRPPAPPPARARPHLRAPLHAGGRRRRARPHLRRRRRHGRAVRRGAALPPRAGVARRRPEGDRHVARERDDPGLPRGLRRRRLPDREPLRRAHGRHRGLHDLRGRQHDPAPARREVAPDRLPRLVRRAQRGRHCGLRREPGLGDGRREVGASAS